MTEQEAIKLHISENIHRIEVIEDFLSTNSDANDKECRKNIDILTKINKALEEVEQYRAIGTPEECRAAVEKQKADKKLGIHDEKHILKSCLGHMQDMVDKFAEWYRWQHGENSIEELDDEERFCIRTTYFRIVQKLFLLHTNHSGGTSTREKCEQLGVDWSEEILLDWSDEE